MRFVVLDTETSGLNRKRNGLPVSNGNRVIEVGCVEIVDGRITGRYFHSYVDGKCDIDPGATTVHGLTSEFLVGKPLFRDIVDEFLRFLEGAVLIIHNAPFDISFLDQEFINLPFVLRPTCTFIFIDTLAIARVLFPGCKNDLDSLCRRFGIHGRSGFHGALTDANLLAAVYLEMTAHK